MFYSYSLVSFIIHHFLILISNANQSVDDKAFIAFMKDYPNSQISEFLKEKYEANLGILYFMKKNWQCDKIWKEFEEYERTECQKYRKYLDILFEYLYREYVGIPAAKPKFVFKRNNGFRIPEIEIEGPIINALYCLVTISQFYFTRTQILVHNLKNLFKASGWDYMVFQPKLLNEERLNYEVKLANEKQIPINEMILQLAIDTANEWPNDGILDGIIRENFNKNLEEMFKMAQERAKGEKLLTAKELKEDKHWIIRLTKFDDSHNWIDDGLFCEFVKGLATNSEKFFKLTKKYSNSKKEDLVQACEVHLCTAYLMRKNWHCDKISEKFEEPKRTKCQKYRNYLVILYEYLFGLYVEVKSPEIKKQLPSLMKPKFFYLSNSPARLFVAVKNLNEISQCFWKKGGKQLLNITFMGINLANEKELNYEINGEKSEENGEDSKTKNEKQKIKHFNDLVEIANLRREFEQKMEKICEKTKENAKEEKAKLEKALTYAGDCYMKSYLERLYDGKFDVFNSSPFS